MITTAGKSVVKRYLAGQGTLAGSIAVGVGATPETLVDAKLAFELGRFDVDLISYDFANNNLVLKGALSPDVAGKIYEIGLWTADGNQDASGFDSMTITSFDSETESWTADTAVYDTTNARLGIDSLRQQPAVSATRTDTLSEIILDLSGYSGTDRFVMAYNVVSNVASARLRFMTDASNYYEFAVTSPTAGYKITEFAKGSATIVGTPSWASITSIQVATTASAVGGADISFDGVRIEDIDTESTSYVLVARKVLATPYVKEVGKAQEFEYALAVTV